MLGRILSGLCRAQLPRQKLNQVTLFPAARTRQSTLLFYSKLPRGYKSTKQQRNIGFVGYIFLVVPATTFCLGVWQYNRRQWKIEKIKELDYKVKQSKPESLPFLENFDDLSELEYAKYEVRGSFDNARELFIGPRSLLDTKGGTSGGIILVSSQDTVGYHVITPFNVENGPTILVNRGWVHRDKLEPAKRSEGQIEGPVSLVGILRINEETSSMVPPNKVDENVWFSRDVDEMAKKFDTSKIYLDLDYESSRWAADRGGPVGGQTRISLRNDHVQYMLTWWGISIATTVLWLKRFIH